MSLSVVSHRAHQLVDPLTLQFPKDVFHELFSKLTLTEFHALSSLNRQWKLAYNQNKHISIQHMFFRQILAVSKCISPLVKEHPFKLELVQDLKTRKDMRATCAWISRWMGQLFVMSKKNNWLALEDHTERNNHDAKKLIHFLSQVSYRHRSDLNHISHLFYQAVRPCDYYENLCSSNPGLDNHPLMRGMIYWHARYSFNSHSRMTSNTDFCINIAGFVRSSPLSAYIKKGDLKLDDIRLPLARFELERWLQPEINVATLLSNYNNLSNDEKNLVVQASIIHHLNRPSDHLETRITHFESLDAFRVRDLRREINSIDYFKTIKKCPRIITIAGLSITALGGYYFDCLLSDKAKEEGLGHKYIFLTIITFTIGVITTVAGLILQCVYSNHNDQRAIFLKK